MEEGQEMKWEGEVNAKLTGPTADQAWSLLKDFCSLDKWVPSINTCYKVEGVDGQPGYVRFCSGPVNRSDDNQTTGWSKEKLIAFDSESRSYSYEIVETNKGFGKYIATIKVVPVSHDSCISAAAAAAAEGCVLKWSFMADPVKGWTQEGFVSYLEKLTQVVAERVVEALEATKMK